VNVRTGTLALLSAAILLTACSSSAKSTGSSPVTSGAATTTTVGKSAATITKFVVPSSVRCDKGTATTIPLTYAISGAQRQGVSVDGRQTELTAPAGRAAPAVHCDPLPHTVTLFAYDAQGRLTSQVKQLTTIVPTP